MMKSKLAAIVGVCFLLSFCEVRSVLAQPVLERLQQSIRDRVGAGSDAATPGEAAPDAKAASAEAVPPPPTPSSGVKAPQRRGYLGATVDDKNDRGRGVRVLEVRPDSPASKGGLQAGDLITALAGIRVRQMSEMADVLSLFPPGETVVLDVLRSDKPQQVKVTLAQPPAAAAAAAEAPEAAGPTPPGSAAPAAAPPAAAPMFPSVPAGTSPAKEPVDQSAAIEQLRQRVEQLERRVEEMEKALAESRKKN